jgi:hypothetical protein
MLYRVLLHHAGCASHAAHPAPPQHAQQAFQMIRKDTIFRQAGRLGFPWNLWFTSAFETQRVQHRRENAGYNEGATIFDREPVRNGVHWSPVYFLFFDSWRICEGHEQTDDRKKENPRRRNTHGRVSEEKQILDNPETILPAEGRTRIFVVTVGW